MVDPGEGPRGPAPSPPPTLFLDQTEAQRTEKFFWRLPPPLPYLRVWIANPPRYLKVWIWHCRKFCILAHITQYDAYKNTLF